MNHTFYRMKVSSNKNNKYNKLALIIIINLPQDTNNKSNSNTWRLSLLRQLPPTTLLWMAIMALHLSNKINLSVDLLSIAMQVMATVVVVMELQDWTINNHPIKTMIKVVECFPHSKFRVIPEWESATVIKILHRKVMSPHIK